MMFALSNASPSATLKLVQVHEQRPTRNTTLVGGKIADAVLKILQRMCLGNVVTQYLGRKAPHHAYAGRNQGTEGLDYDPC